MVNARVLPKHTIKPGRYQNSKLIDFYRHQHPHQHVHVNTEKTNKEIAELQERNELLWKLANAKLLADTNRVQSSQVKFKHEKVCQDYESKLNDCYMRNSGKPLLCSSLAKEFWQCVNSKKQISK